MKWLIKKRDGKIETDGEAIVRLMEEKYRMYYQYMNAEIHNNFILLRKLMNQNTKEPEKWDTEPWCSIEGILFDIEAMALTPEEAVPMLDKHIAQLLLSQKNELVGEIQEKQRKEDDCRCAVDAGCGCKIDDYNDALKDIMALINKK